MIQTTLSARRALQVLLALAAVVLLIGYIRDGYAMAMGLRPNQVGFRWASLDGDPSLGAWFTSLTMLLSATLMVWVHVIEKGMGTRTALGWLLLAIGFVYMSIDEMAQIHEFFAIPSGIPSPLPFPVFRWLFVGIPLVLVVGLFFIPFLLRLPRRTALRLVIAGAIYVTGALGFETINGAVLAAQRFSASYIMLMWVEETLEVVGMLLGLRAVLLHLTEELQPPALQLTR